MIPSTNPLEAATSDVALHLLLVFEITSGFVVVTTGRRMRVADTFMLPSQFSIRLLCLVVWCKEMPPRNSRRGEDKAGSPDLAQHRRLQVTGNCHNHLLHLAAGRTKSRGIHKKEALRPRTP